jgi:hypothetical protein
MYKRLIIASIGILFPILVSYAQTAEDALLFSTTSTYGTARFQGMGGAQTALGADISSIAGNPAGLGFFRKSEWSITPSLGFANTKSDFLNTITTDGKSSFSIANLGIVFANPKDDIVGGKWRGGAFGISFNRMNSYQNQFSYQGVNNRNSLTYAFVDRATGIPLRDFEDNLVYDYDPRLQLAFDTYLINPDKDYDEEYFSSAIEAPADQRETVNYSGARYQWNFSYGGNYADKLYFGASMGLSRIRYGIISRYQERIVADPRSLYLESFTLNEDVDIRGTGVNFSAGLIYKANDIVRFGASIVSPTYYWKITDNYRPSISATFESTQGLDLNPNKTVALRQSGSFNEVPPLDYILTTPFSGSLGLAVFAGKNGFITADVTYSTLNTTRFSSNNNDDFGGENDFISRNYQPTIHARVGGEYRKDIFRVRAGAGYQTDPYKDMVDNLNRARLNFSAGAGVRLPTFYIDLAVVHSRFDSGFTPYTISYEATPSVNVKNRLTNAVLSFGMFF